MTGDGTLVRGIGLARDDRDSVLLAEPSNQKVAEIRSADQPVGNRFAWARLVVVATANRLPTATPRPGTQAAPALACAALSCFKLPVRG